MTQSSVSGGANPASGYAAALMNPGAAPLTGVPDQATTKPTYKDRWSAVTTVSSSASGVLLNGFSPTLYGAQYGATAYTSFTVTDFTNSATLNNPDISTYDAQLQETRPVAASLELQWVYASTAAGPLPSGSWYYRMIESGEAITNAQPNLTVITTDPRWIKIDWGGDSGKQAYLTWAPSSGDKVYSTQTATAPAGFTSSSTSVTPAIYSGIMLIGYGLPVSATLCQAKWTIMFEGTTSGSVLKGTINTYTADAESIGNNIMSMFHGPAATGQHPAADHGKASVLSSMLGFAKKAEGLATNPTVDAIAKDAAVVAA